MVQADQENDNNQEEPSEGVKVRLAGCDKDTRRDKGMAGEKKEGI